MLFAAQATSLGFGGWMTLAVLLTIFTTLLCTKLPADIAFLGGVIVLLLTGSIALSDALSGFSAPVVATLGSLFVVTAGLESTGVMKLALIKVFGRPKTATRALVRMILSVSALSAFMSNTLVVSMLTPVVKMWTRRLGVAPSKFLIPLSYASCMGGLCLLIGTPANLVIAETCESAFGIHFNICTPLVPGLCVVALGTVVMVVLNGLLPIRRTAEDGIPDLAKSYELKVRRDSHLVGMTLKDADIPTDDGRSRLTGLLRFDGEMEANPNAETTFLMGGDALYFTGSRRHVAAIAKRCDFEIPDSLADVQKVTISPRMLAAMGIFAAMVGVASLTSVPLTTCCLGAALLMLAFGCCSIPRAKRSVNWDLLLVFAGSVVFGKAVDRTGVAEVIAQGLLNSCGLNPLAALTLMSVAASILTEFVSNTACAAVLAPIGAQIAAGCGVSPTPFFVALMVNCSASFMTPMGGPQHLIVMSAGGYRFADFLRLGIPMSLVSIGVAVFVVPRIFPFVAT